MPQSEEKEKNEEQHSSPAVRSVDQLLWDRCWMSIRELVMPFFRAKPRRALKRLTDDSRLAPRHKLIIEGSRTDQECFSDRWPFGCFIYGFGFLFWVYKRSGQVSQWSILVCLCIVIAVRESLRTVRWQSFSGKYGMMRTAVQMIGDLLTVFPYRLLFVTSEVPMRIYQNTELNRKIIQQCPSLKRFSPTPWLRHPYLAWGLLAIEESYTSWMNWSIFREVLTMPDGGTIALDWSVKREDFDRACELRRKRRGLLMNKNDNDFDLFPLAFYELANGDEYHSSCFRQYTPLDYEEAFSAGDLILDSLKKHNNDNNNNSIVDEFDEESKLSSSNLNYNQTQQSFEEYTSESSQPIMVLFSTFSGDSMSGATRKIHHHFTEHGWRVVVLVKRGGGAVCSEILPMSNARSFCFRSERDTDLAMHLISQRYPRAPILVCGLSIGASQAGDYVARHSSDASLKKSCPNLRGFVRIDGPSSMASETESFSKRQWLVSQVLATFVRDESFIPFSSKSKERESEMSRSGFDLEKVKANDSFMHMVEHIMAPSHGHVDPVQYLHTVSPLDPEVIAVPTLFLNSWNDAFMHPYDMPLNVAQINPRIIHGVSVGGTHVFRREGLFADRSWMAQVALEFGNAVVSL